MDQRIRDDFLGDAKRIFAFLASEYGFDGPIVNVNEAIHFTLVSYIRQNIAIELILDEREEDVTCKIARVVHGKKTPHYERDDAGVLVRDDLYSLLRRRGVRERLARPVGHLKISERIPIILEDCASMLRRHALDVLQDSASVFEV